MTKLLALLALCAAFVGCTQIDTGNVGVERTLGNVKPQELTPGLYQTFTKTVDEFTGKEVPLSITDLKPKSSDNLTMADVDIDLYFKVRPDKMADLFIKYQGDVSNVYTIGADGKPRETDDRIVGMGRVTREAREQVYRAIAEFSATTMHTKREEIANRIRVLTQKELDATDPASFEVTNVNVRALVTDPALEESIRNRARLDQQIAAKVKENELAAAEAARKLIDANGEAAANNALAASITPNLIELKRIEAMLATSVSKGSSTIFVPYGQPINPLVQTK